MKKASQLRIKTSFGIKGDAVLPVKITNLSRKERRLPYDVAVRTNSDYDISLPAGEYVVQTVLPTGKRVRRTVKLTEGMQELVELNEAVPSSHEFLAKASFVRKHIQESLHQRPRYSPDFYFRILEKRDGEWTSMAVDESAVNRLTEDASSVLAEIRHSPVQQLRYLAVGGPKVPVRISVIPPYVYSQSIITKRQKGDFSESRPDPVSVSVVTENLAAESMMSYWINGKYDAVGTISNEVAHQLLAAKEIDPIGALGGAYVSLQVGGLNDVLHWLVNLADRFPVLSDTYLILGTLGMSNSISIQTIRNLSIMKGLRMTQSGDPVQARIDLVIHCLGMAYDCDLPVYTQGLRLHRDMLDFLDSCASNSEVHGRLEGARELISSTTTLKRSYNPKRWAKTMDHWVKVGSIVEWNCRFLTLYSDRPDRVYQRSKFWSKSPE